MKRSVNRIVCLDIIFLAFLISSGLFTGVLSIILYYLAFIVPIVLGFSFFRGSAETPVRLIGKRLDARVPMLLTPLTLGLVLLLSAGLKCLFDLLALPTGQTDVSGTVTALLIVDAICPAILEEILFRYIPLRLLAPESRLGAVVFSSLLFAVSHASLYQFLYALVAGIFFAVIDIAAGSVLPSIVLHLVNNAISLVLLRSFPDPTVPSLFLGAALTAVGILFIRIFRKELYPVFDLYEKDEEPLPAPPTLIVYLLACLLLTVSVYFV